MVTKTRKESSNKKKKVKVLNLKKESVKNLTDHQANAVKGGARVLEGYKITVSNPSVPVG